MAGASSSSLPTSPRTRGAARTLTDLPAGAPGGEADRSDLRSRAHDQRRRPRHPSRRASYRGGTTGRRSRDLDAQRARASSPVTRASPRRWTTCSSAGPLRPLPRGRPDLPQQQRRRAQPARCGSRAQVMAVLRLRARWRQDRLHVHADLHRQAQRRRSAGLARGCPRPHRRPASLHVRLLPWAWARQRAARAIAA